MSAALDILYGLILDDGRRWGEAAEPWQRADAAAVLEPGPGDPRQHWLGRPKGGSKSTDLAGMSSAWLLTQAPPMVEGFAVAADEEQANRLLDKARGFVAREPALQGRLKVEAKRIVNLVNGARVQALAADVAGSEGLLTPWVVVDELPNWLSTASAKAMWTSVVSAVPKWPEMRLVVIGHASDPTHWAHKVLVHAKSSRLWRVNEVPGPLPWVSSEALDDQRALLTESQFARRHLNVWQEGDDRLSSLEDLRACVTLDGPKAPEHGHRYVIGCDLGLKSDRTVAAVCHVDRRSPVAEAGTSSAPVVLDRMGVWQGTKAKPVDLGLVEAWLAHAAREYGASIVIDPYQAAQMATRLRTQGFRVTEYTFSQQSIGRLATAMFLTIRNHGLALPDDDELIDELANVRLVETSPNVIRMDHIAGQHDDRAIALALAVQDLLSGPGQRASHYLEGLVPLCPACSTPVAIEDTTCGSCGVRQVRASAGDPWARKPRMCAQCWEANPSRVDAPDLHACQRCGNPFESAN